MAWARGRGPLARLQQLRPVGQWPGRQIGCPRHRAIQAPFRPAKLAGRGATRQASLRLESDATHAHAQRAHSQLLLRGALSRAKRIGCSQLKLLRRLLPPAERSRCRRSTCATCLPGLDATRATTPPPPAGHQAACSPLGQARRTVWPREPITPCGQRISTARPTRGVTHSFDLSLEEATAHKIPPL